jgi:alanyl-tRNA synthetase
MKPNPGIDSALHVLKGAAQKVLDTSLTASVYAEESRGRLTVEYDGSPTEEQIAEIEALANQKIAEDVPIERIEMDRQEAEEKFGNIIYDKFPVPPHVKKLTIARIEMWNINCCLGPHLKTTGEIGSLKITRHRARPNRKELEISFEVE